MLLVLVFYMHARMYVCMYVGMYVCMQVGRYMFTLTQHMYF